MIETIDQITTDDLFHALGNSAFVLKLHDASRKRVKHHHGWVQFHRKNKREESVSKEYKKIKLFIRIRRALVSLI